MEVLAHQVDHQDMDLEVEVVLVVLNTEHFFLNTVFCCLSTEQHSEPSLIVNKGANSLIRAPKRS